MKPKQNIRRLLFTLFTLTSLSLFAGERIIDNRTYQSGERVVEDGNVTISTTNAVIVQPNAEVYYDAASQILLRPGFHAQQGSTFIARVPDWSAFAIHILNGDNQSAVPGAVNAEPLDVIVLAGSPLSNLPVTFTVEQGGGSISLERISSFSSQLTQVTDMDGTVRVYYRQPLNSGMTSIIRASVPTGQFVQFISQSTNSGGSGGGGGGSGGGGGTNDDGSGGPGGTTPPNWSANPTDNPASFAVYSPATR